MFNTSKQDILKAYQWRHACKEFDATRKLAAEDFDFLLNIISLSASSFGLQPYEVFVLQNETLLKEMHPHMWGAQKQLFTADKILMFAAKTDISIHDSYYEYMAIEIQNTPPEMQEKRRALIHEYHLNEVKAAENPRFLTEWAMRQAYIALGNLMSSAALIGIDSCPVEGFLRDKITPILAKHKVIAEDKYTPAVFCCLGYRLADPLRPKARKPLNKLIHYF